MPVMCMQNLDVSIGICNGTMMVVERIEHSIAWCRVNTRFGQSLHPFGPTRHQYSLNGLKFTRVQLPLRVAFAATINRAQGGTFDKVGFHDLKHIWAHGMLYTAVTRVTSAEGLRILCDPEVDYVQPTTGETFATTRNVVHPRVSGRTETQSTANNPTDAATNNDPQQDVIDGEDMYDGPEFQFYHDSTGATGGD